MKRSAAMLARGPWPVDRVHAHWREEHYEPSAEHTVAADAAIEALRERGSPSHDGLAARLVAHAEEDDRLVMDLQPMRWALRLVEDDASHSLAALTVTRSADGRWLAGRRAAWLSSWPGRWALGAGGAVDVGESPARTLSRELQEEWSLEAERMSVEALIRLPQQLVLVVGLAWLPDGAEDDLVMDAEHDACAWWPADPADWPSEADDPLRRIALMLDGAAR
jgi:ADP-ribose pyrophosphatase YjhB (NUDIX family)